MGEDLKFIEDNKFEILKMELDHQVKNLEFRTSLDFKILFGYVTLALAFVAWYAQMTIPPERIIIYRILFSIFAVAIWIAAVISLYLNFRQRRYFALRVIESINIIFKFKEKGIYLPNESLHPDVHKIVFWFKWLCVPATLLVFVVQAASIFLFK